ncbi:type VII toxin-antitoxin system HepT family RNase toxin [Tepidibacillus sp. LV47]|uniref:type VII toxin-antitoxin system HepT family RNase toxin n=1 Tax=Tepidibacillus sp. LV47 TaxID=3398228 RepID=UPI003AAA2D5C
MYNVNTKRIDKILDYMKNVLEIVKPLTILSFEEFIQDSIVVLAAERAVHIAIESIVDVGNYLIDGFIMRDPGSYTDIIEILRDERVLPDQDAEILKEFVAYRKLLVHDYTENDPELLYKQLTNSFSTVYHFEQHVRSYLKQEL